jgi:RNA polymerase sigma factor (sigma-70 family)
VLTAGANFYTSKKRRQAREGVHIRNSETVCCSDFSKDNLRAAVERAMQTLDDNLRLPLSLHYQQGLSYAEAAQLLNVPENSLRVYAQRGIQRLRDKLTREGFSVD